MHSFDAQTFGPCRGGGMF